MIWVFYALLAALLWAITNIIDKYVLGRTSNRAIVPIVFSGFYGALAALAIYLIKGYQTISFNHQLFGLFTGFLFFLGVILYNVALKYDEVSRVVPLYSTTPLFVAIIAAIFLGEVFHIYKYLGIGLLVIGSLLITYKKKLHLGPSFWCIILASMGWGFCVVIIKYLLEFADFWTIFSYLRLGGLITAIPVAIVFYKDLKIGLQKDYLHILSCVGFSRTFSLCAMITYMASASTGFITLVDALSTMQHLFLLFLTIIISIFYPKILKEEINKRTVCFKLVAVVLLILGAAIVSL